MEKFRLNTHVGSDGILKLGLPIGEYDVDCEIVVTVKRKMTTEEWHAFIDETAGSLADDPIERLPQGAPDIRDEILLKYLLDTNTCIRHLNQRSPSITSRLRTLSLIDVAVCSVVKAELFAGAGKSTDPVRTLATQQLFLDQFVSLPFDDQAAIVYGSVRAALEKAGRPIGPLDTLIAAIALVNDLILVTHNTAEFSRIPRLKLEDWEL